MKIIYIYVLFFNSLLGLGRHFSLLQNVRLSGAKRREFRVISASATVKEASNYIPAAPILLPEGPWKQVMNLISETELLFVMKYHFTNQIMTEMICLFRSFLLRQHHV